MLRRLRFAALLVGACAGFAAAAASATDLRLLWRENLRLKAEQTLAQKPKTYFLLDLGARSIALKTRGMTMLEIPIVEYGTWGRQLPISQRAVVQKDALPQAARPEIKPGEEKSAAELDDSLLELSDMPLSYRFGLAGDVDVVVLPVVEGRWPRFRQRAYLWRWWLSRPLLTLREHRERAESTSLFLVLRPEDARSLYWTFYEGLEGIVLPPGS